VTSTEAAPVSEVTLADTTKDVWVIGPGEDDWDPYGAKPAVDVTRAVLRHHAHAVTATMWFVDLHRVGLQDMLVKMRTPDLFRRADLWFGPDDRDGRLELRNRDYELMRCAGLRHDVDYGRDRVHVRVPRSCLGDPEQVRVKAWAFLFREWSELADNPYNAGPKPEFTEPLVPEA
jgi:hypothetical protein